ncbi:MAG: GAF domain-containing protein [Propionibacteriaceae bacterium]
MITAADELELMTSIAAVAAQRLGAAACSVALVEGSELVFVAASGTEAAQVVGMRIPVGRGIAGWVAASGQGIAVADVARDQRFDEETALRTGYLPASILAVPVDSDDGPLGVLEVLDRTPGAHDLEVAGAAARQIALTRLLAEGRSDLDAELGDPELAELLALIGRLRSRTAADRRLAARLLRAVLEDDA